MFSYLILVNLAWTELESNKKSETEILNFKLQGKEMPCSIPGQGAGGGILLLSWDNTIHDSNFLIVIYFVLICL